MKMHRIKVAETMWLYFSRVMAAMNAAGESAKTNKRECKVQTVNLTAKNILDAMNGSLDHSKLKATTAFTVTE